MNKTEYSLFNVNMTASTSSNDVKETIEDKLEKRTKELYVPLNGILFQYMLYKLCVLILLVLKI